MAIPIEMPKLSDTMEEGVLSAWLVDEGDAVSAGDILAQVETDKATMDLEAFDDGILLRKLIDEGDAVPIGALIAVIGEEDEDISNLLSEASGDGAAAEDAAQEEEAGNEAPEPAEPTTAETSTAETDAAPAGDGQASEPQVSERAPEPVPAGTDAEGHRIKASPLARSMAKTHELELASIEGTGPQGRIIKRDVEAKLAEPEPETAPEPEPETAPETTPEATPSPAPRATEQPAYAVPEPEAYESEDISQMRKTIARRLAQSKFTAPHFYLTVDIDMAKAIDFRAELNELAEKQDRPRISYNDLITKACALALKQHPQVNSSYLADEGEIRYHKQVHVGIAVAIEAGLITPVIRNADQKGLGQIAGETRTLAEKARDRGLQPEEFEGSTFTTSNLGMFGIEEFTAIINPPNACILAIGGIREEPVVEDGAVVPGTRMKVTLSCDHRIVDGATGAAFLSTVQDYLEEPMNLLL